MKTAEFYFHIGNCDFPYDKKVPRHAGLGEGKYIPEAIASGGRALQRGSLFSYLQIKIHRVKAFMIMALIALTMMQFTSVSTQAGINWSSLDEDSDGSDTASSGFTPPEICYDSTALVERGSIRYMSQKLSSPYYNQNLWSPWNGVHECLTASMSMVLSYLGLDITPAQILNEGGGSTVDMKAWGGAGYRKTDFQTAMNDYLNGNGGYSPPIIHLTAGYPMGHYLPVFDYLGGNTYVLVDPTDDNLWTAAISGNTITYDRYGGTYTIDLEPVTQYSIYILPMTYEIESPLSNENCQGQVTVTGWALYEEELEKIYVTSHGKLLECTLSDRSDVNADYPDYSHSGVGFTVDIPLGTFTTGENTIRILADTAGGDSADIGEVKINYTYF